MGPVVSIANAEPLAQVGNWLGRAQRGYYQYHAVSGEQRHARALPASSVLAVVEDRRSPQRAANAVGTLLLDVRPLGALILASCILTRVFASTPRI